MVKKIASDVTIHTKEIDQLNQHSRKLNVRIYGAEYKNGEKLDEILEDIVTNGLKLDKIVLTRLQSKHRCDRDRKGIMIRFIYANDKQMVMSSRTNLRSYKYLGKSIYVNDDLSKLQLLEKSNRDKVFMAMRAQGASQIRKVSYDKICVDGKPPCHYKSFSMLSNSNAVPIGNVLQVLPTVPNVGGFAMTATTSATEKK